MAGKCPTAGFFSLVEKGIGIKRQIEPWPIALESTTDE
jgi:hypothetical protein